jgi:hydrogenase-4 component B
MDLLLSAIGLMAISGILGVASSRRSPIGQILGALFEIAGCSLGLFQTWTWLATEEPWEPIRFPWLIPGVEFHVGIDGISALFLAPIFLIALLGSVYGLSYWRQEDHPDNGRKLRLFYGLMPAGMALLVIARDALLFLVAWEVMALSAFFLVTTEDDEQPAREAGWIYLAATHLGTLFLFALFALLRSVSGSFTLDVLAEDQITPGLSAAMFLLGLVGFGIKAGIMPLHVWLPSAHAIAPSHVSALMSGVLIKMGIYGLVRVSSLLPNPPIWWGGLLLGLGVLSGILGVAFAIGQHDLKRLLAYHSIENIGIIVMGLGLAMVGRSLHRIDWILLGLGGALLHVWNHALFKALLFLSAGSVIHVVHTRDIDHLGGLAKTMPRTALGFLIGAVAICGLPPLNGFISELLIYLGLFRTLGLNGDLAWPGAAFAVPALALIGALAVACFVKVYGAVFLGAGRSAHVRHAHESGITMVAPLGVLAACCFAIGLAPQAVAPVLERAVFSWLGEPINVDLNLAAIAPLQVVGLLGLVLLALVAAAGLFLWSAIRQVDEPAPTWDCGYAAPSARMQYTSSSFAQMLVGLFAWALRPRIKQPRVMGLFPGKAEFHSEVPDAVLEDVVLPSSRFLARLASWLRVFQQGSIQAYLVYIVAILIVLFLWR